MSAAIAITSVADSPAPAVTPDQVNSNPTASAGRNVRACINNYAVTPGQVKMHSPLRAEGEFINSHVELLPYEGISPLCLDKGKTFLSLQHQYFVKSKTVILVQQDEDYVPILARVDLKVKSLEEAEELPEFIELQNETTPLVKIPQVVDYQVLHHCRIILGPRGRQTRC
jgi:hypothetical protein